MPEVLNATFANKKVDKPYPNLEVVTIGVALPVVLPLLQQGDLPVIGTYQGVERMLGSIDPEATNIFKLLKATKLIYNKSASEHYEINEASDIFEAGVGL